MHPSVEIVENLGYILSNLGKSEFLLLIKAKLSHKEKVD